MGCPSFQEGLIIVFVVVLILGASRLPQLGDGLGRAVRNFKKGLKGENEIDVTPKKKLPPPDDEG
ncbi:MAG: twin-arginine translocase TatA/TatE family subunit [Myxococcales bacterium]|nr:twin-arginine translocase TatA/TatE family subunit [Myxococcales bacterium]MCB9652125.1 twin-arginine translocase TatA/TatE family subunit [Deltaproteobacteria bacterium]